MALLGETASGLVFDSDVAGFSAEFGAGLEIGVGDIQSHLGRTMVVDVDLGNVSVELNSPVTVYDNFNNLGKPGSSIAFDIGSGLGYTASATDTVVLIGGSLRKEKK